LLLRFCSALLAHGGRGHGVFAEISPKIWKQAYESDLEHIVTNIYAMCKAQQELLQDS